MPASPQTPQPGTRRPPTEAAAFATPDFFVLRTPLLPVDELFALGAELTAAHATPTELPAALAADRARLRDRLRGVLARPEVREAIFLASPSLEENIDAWLQDPQSERGQRAEPALLRYLARMAGRPTPFGLFAGYSLGRAAEATALRVAGRESYVRHTRLDDGYLAALAGHLGTTEDTKLLPNSSLYQAAGRLCYLRALQHGAALRYEAVSEAAPAPAAAFALALDRLAATPGGLSATELGAALAAVLPDAHAARAYVRTLIERQLLVPALAPPMTGAAPLAGLVAQLAGHPAQAALSRAGDALAALDREGLGAAPARYRTLAAELGALPVAPALAQLFYVDLHKPAPTATLGRYDLAALADGAALLARIAGGDAGDDALAVFREAFRRRFEDQEIPLALALDEHAGVAFPAPGAPSAERLPLLDDLPFPATAGAATGAPWGRRQTRLLRVLEDALQRGAREAVLSVDDIQALTDPRAVPLPDACAVTATLVQRAPGAAPSFYLSDVVGPSGVSRLGRFCHGDAALRARVERHLRAEEALRPDALFAEVVHLPAGPMGTLASRPRLRTHEIPYLGRGDADEAHQLPLADLRVSVRGDRVVLRSARLQREVLPRITTPHNFSTGCNLRLYRFLGALQSQGTQREVRFSWGALEDAAFLPRLVHGRVILSLARWRLRREEWQEAVHQPAAAFAVIQRLRAAGRLPRFVALMDRDNLLPLDLDNVLSIESLLPLVKDRAEATLVELLVGEDADERCAEGPEGRFVHQLLVPLLRTRTLSAAQAPTPPAPRGARSFAPGSEWLFAKIYTDKQSADEVLLDAVGPVLRRAQETGAVTGWFFLRYGDPDWHLRVRVQGAPERLLCEVLPALHQALAPHREAGRVGRLVLDTYEREIERYGGDAGIELAERLFQADSEAALDVLAALRGHDEDARWRCALWGMDRLLVDLGLDAMTRWAVLSVARERFAAEFAVDAPLQRALGARYRRERPTLEALRAGRAPGFEPVAAAFARRAERLRPVATALHRAAQEGRLGTLVEVLALSYVHMHANRLLRAAARPQELALYDFLERLYEADDARARQGATATVNPEDGALRP